MTTAAQMTQGQRRLWLIKALLAEHERYRDTEVPASPHEQRLLLRALFNLRPPEPASEELLSVQDAYLRQRTHEKGITRLDDLSPIAEGLYLWRGDITTLAVDAIVNAANSQMLGCFVPNHGCIDNAIHSFAGVQLRLACAEQMAVQGHEEPTGSAKLTPGFNLPAAHVIHTVGPIVGARVTPHDRAALASCYRACLELAEDRGLRSIAFCCISTGEFHYPNDEAARVAIDSVRSFRHEHNSDMEVVFNVFKPMDEAIYRNILSERA